MKRFFGKKVNENILIEGDEFVHLRKVLRMNEGGKVIASINDEFDYYCTISRINKSDCLLSIDEKERCPALPNKNIVLYQMMPKKDYFDNILAKSIELGVSKIVPFTSEYTMIKTYKKERVQTQIMTACKQCERSLMPEISEMKTFSQILEELKDFDLVIFAYENEKEPFNPKILENKQNIAVVIGNEAGFSENEAKALQKVSTSISLGKRILRCDTAVVATLSLVAILSKN